MDTLGKIGTKLPVSTTVTTGPAHKQINIEQPAETRQVIQTVMPAGEEYTAGPAKGAVKDILNNLGNTAKNITGESSTGQNQVTVKKISISAGINPGSEITQLNTIGTRAMNITGGITHQSIPAHVPLSISPGSNTGTIQTGMSGSPGGHAQSGVTGGNIGAIQTGMSGSPGGHAQSGVTGGNIGAIQTVVSGGLGGHGQTGAITGNPGTFQTGVLGGNMGHTQTGTLSGNPGLAQTVASGSPGGPAQTGAAAGNTGIAHTNTAIGNFLASQSGGTVTTISNTVNTPQVSLDYHI